MHTGEEQHQQQQQNTKRTEKKDWSFCNILSLAGRVFKIAFTLHYFYLFLFFQKSRVYALCVYFIYHIYLFRLSSMFFFFDSFFPWFWAHFFGYLFHRLPHKCTLYGYSSSGLKCSCSASIYAALCRKRTILHRRKQARRCMEQIFPLVRQQQRAKRRKEVN